MVRLLNVSYVQLTFKNFYRDTFIGLLNLQTLNLSSSHITKIDMHSKLPLRLHIAETFLQHNLISNIVFNQNMIDLGFVDLSRNRLQSFKLIPNSQKASNSIFNLSENEISIFQIETDRLQNDDKFTFAMENYNQFDNCSCFMEQLNTLKSKFDQFSFHFGDTICKSMLCEFHKRDKRSSEVNVSELRHDWTTQLVIICVIVVCASCLLAALFYKFRQETKKFFNDVICSWFLTEAEFDKDKKFDAFFCFHSSDKPIADIIMEKFNGFTFCICNGNFIIDDDALPDFVSTKV